MIDAAICDGDWVVVASSRCRNGDIVAAMIDGEATVKTFKRRDGHVWLMPHNADLRADPRRRRHDPGPGDGGPAPGLATGDPWAPALQLPSRARSDRRTWSRSSVVQNGGSDRRRNTP